MSLLEMARWPSGHAYPFLLIIGRIAGIEESALEKLAIAGDVDEIIAALNQR